MKYEVGDKVRIRKDLIVGRLYGGLECLPSHKKYCGRILTIEGINGKDYLLIGGEGYWWPEEMFEGLAEMGKIEIIVDGNKTIAKKDGKVGIAKCSPEDDFDIFTGVRLAIDRLEEECKPYSWLKNGVKYYYPCVGMNDLYDCCTYATEPYHKRMINRGLVFKTKEEAVAAAKKMLAVLKESDSNDERRA